MVTKKEKTKKAKRVAERAESMRKGITTGRQVKSHVKVRVRLKNGNRLTGVVKDGRLVERVDGLRFVDAQARDRGAGIRLWYSGGTRSYIFVPFRSLRTYEVVQRLSQQQLLDIEKEMQMTEKRAKERAAREARKAQGKAEGYGAATEKPAGAPDVRSLDALKPGVSEVGGAKPATEVPAPTGTTQPAAKKSVVAKVGEGVKTGADTSKQLLWSELLRKYPPKQGWNEAKKQEIMRRPAVIGAQPSAHEKAFVKQFRDWVQACEHHGINPKGAVEKKPETRRQKRLRERNRRRGR